MSDPGHRLRRVAWLGALGVAVVAAAPAYAAGAGNGNGGASTELIPGSATAIAQAVQLAPATSGLNYAITAGIAIGGYSGSQGKAQAQTLDLGIIGTTLTAEQCDGSDATLSPDQVPQPLIVESQGEKKSKDNTQAGQVPPAAIGTEHVEADGTPSGYAKTTGLTLGVPGVLTLAGGTSEATGRLIEGTAREAAATTTFGQLQLAGGLVELDGLVWHAEQRTGDDSKVEKAQGSFSIGALKLAGRPLPVDQDSIGASIDAVNDALKPIGIYLKLPTFSRTDDGTARVSPLVIGMDDSQVGQQVFGPVLGAGQPVRDALVQAFTGLSCKASTLFLLGDIGSGPLTGAGSVALNIGGIEATSEGVDYGNAFDDFGDFGGGPVALPPVPPVGGGGAVALPSTPTVALPDTGNTTTGPTAGGAPAVATAPVVQSRSCSSTHDGGGDCAGDSALAVGLGALGAILAVAGADTVFGRRRGRRLTQLRL